LRESVPITLTLMCYQGRDLEESSKSFSRRSLFIKKGLIPHRQDEVDVTWKVETHMK